MMSQFCLLLVGHALADYPLQGDFLAKAKNHTAPIPGVPWIHGLLWHAVIHGGFVGLITGSWVLGVAEALVHALIDFGKSAEWYSLTGWLLAPKREQVDVLQQVAFHIDQGLHVACKALWVILYAAGVG